MKSTAVFFFLPVLTAIAQSTANCQNSFSVAETAWEACGVQVSSNGNLIIPSNQPQVTQCICQQNNLATLNQVINACQNVQGAQTTVATLQQIEYNCQGTINSNGNPQQQSGSISSGNAQCDAVINSGVTSLAACGVQVYNGGSNFNGNQQQVSCVCQQNTLASLASVFNNCYNVPSVTGTISAIQNIASICRNSGIANNGPVINNNGQSGSGTPFVTGINGQGGIAPTTGQVNTGNGVCDASVRSGLAAWSSCGVQFSTTGSNFNGNQQQVSCICSQVNLQPIQNIINTCSGVSGASGAMVGLQNVISSCNNGMNAAGISSGITGSGFTASAATTGGWLHGAASSTYDIQRILMIGGLAALLAA